MDRQPEIVVSGLNVPEGPVWTGDGRVIVVEQFVGRLTATDPGTGASSVLASMRGNPNGAARDGAGFVYIANSAYAHSGWRREPEVARALPHLPGSVQRVSPYGAVETLYDGCDGQFFAAPNDIALTGDGGAYFTDYYAHRVYYMGVDGSHVRSVARDVAFANGLVLSADRRTLFVAEYRRGVVIAFEVGPDGDLGRRRDFAQLPPGGSPDGLCLDASGYLLAASPTSGVITSFTPDGYLDEVIEMPFRLVTNLAFGGPNLEDLYITGSPVIPVGAALDEREGVLLHMSWPRPGLQLPG